MNRLDVEDAAPPIPIDAPNCGESENTTLPLPVSSVIADARFADDGVARNVATPVPRPLTPVLIGSPVQFVSVPDVGVPKTGVTIVNDVHVPLGVYEPPSSRIVSLASLNVFVRSAVVGPENFVNPFPVPPYVLAMTCVSAAVPSKLFP